jgi:predicted HTH transcriptional regulator
VQNAESNKIEFKRELNDKLERSVVAFLNANEGGLLYIGVDDNGVHCGVDDIDLVQRQIVDRIKDNVSPSALGLFDVVAEKTDGIPVIKIIVSSGIEKPYYIRSFGRSEKGCFIRVGSSVQPMPTRMIDDLYARRRPVSLGNIPAPRRDLTFEQLEIYYQAKKLKLNERFKTSLELLLPDGNDNFVAYMLADENAISVKIAKYAGRDKTDLIENYEYGYCCLIKATNQVLDRLDVENRTFAKITPKTRVEKQMVDRTALREAVINAVVHNDYSRNAVPTVELFADRITITSYGGLPEGLTRESFFECCSMPRNRELMRVFRDVGLAEQLGSGMGRILNAYDKSVFSFAGDFLIVTLPFAEGFDSMANANGGNFGDNGDNLGDKIVELIRNDIKISRAELAHAVGLPSRSLDRAINALKATGAVRRVGSTRAGHWVVNG